METIGRLQGSSVFSLGSFWVPGNQKHALPIGPYVVPVLWFMFRTL